MMLLPDQYPEIWSNIISFLERPKPALKTEAWRELHQDDLATMMRVSKMCFHLTAPILYREPIVENVWSFLVSRDLEEDLEKEALLKEHGHTRGIGGTPEGSHALTEQEKDELKDEAEEMDQGEETSQGSRIAERRVMKQIPEENERPWTSKAYCFKFTERIHIIHLHTSYSFNYFTLLFQDYITRMTYWEYLDVVEYPHKVEITEPTLCVYAHDMVSSYVDHLYNLLEDLTNYRGSTQQLRPKTVSYGAYGDLSWNARQETCIAGDHPAPRLIALHKEIRPGGLESLRNFVETSMSWPSLMARITWSGFEPEAHCTRCMGGPHETASERTFIDWTGDEEPSTIVTHCEHADPRFGLTLGVQNIVIFESTPSLDGDPEAWLDRLTQVCHIYSARSPPSSQDPIDHTTIAIYGPPTVRRGKSNESMEDLKALQRIIDDDTQGDLGLLKGRIKVHHYEDAPACPSCGWEVESIEKEAQEQNDA